MADAKLSACNQLLELANTLPVAALDEAGVWPSHTYGPSLVGQASRVLDETVWDVLSAREFQECHIANYSISTNGSNELDFTSLNAIWIRPKGSMEGQNIQLARNATGSTARAYNYNTGTYTFTAGTYTFEVWVQKSYYELTDRTRALCLARAKERFSMTKTANTAKHAYIQGLKAEVEAFNAANRPTPKDQPLNGPLVAQPQQG